MESPQNIKNKTTMWSSSSSSWYLSKKKKKKNHPTLFHKYVFITMLIAASFIIAKTWKQPICLLTDEQTKKILYT